MLGEFVYQTRVYCIKSILDPKTPDEHKIKFKYLNDAKHFFGLVASDKSAREELLEVAQWLHPTSCRPPKNCPKPTGQELLDLLCLYVYENGLKGDYRLVELKPPTPTLKFEKCCVESIKSIDIIVDNSKLIGSLLCIAQVHSTMASHTRLPALASALSAAYNAKDSDWKKVADAMASLSDVKRQSIYDITRYEYHKHHEVENNRELGKYWKGVMDAAYE
jgi:hypothetical protein